MVFYDSWLSENPGRVDNVTGENCCLEGDVLFFSLLVLELSIDKINCGLTINGNGTLIKKILLIKY